MRILSRAIVAGVFAAGGGLAAARGQEPGLGGILGGYGAMSEGAGSSMGGGYSIVGLSGARGSVIGPAAMAGMGGGLGFRPPTAAGMGPARPPFGPDRAGGLRRPFRLSEGSLSGGAGIGAGMRRMPSTTGMGVMPPRIGYPFRQPPSLVPRAAPGSGMSM